MRRRDVSEYEPFGWNDDQSSTAPGSDPGDYCKSVPYVLRVDGSFGIDVNRTFKFDDVIFGLLYESQAIMKSILKLALDNARDVQPFFENWDMRFSATENDATSREYNKFLAKEGDNRVSMSDRKLRMLVNIYEKVNMMIASVESMLTFYVKYRHLFGQTHRSNATIAAFILELRMGLAKKINTLIVATAFQASKRSRNRKSPTLNPLQKRGMHIVLNFEHESTRSISTFTVPTIRQFHEMSEFGMDGKLSQSVKEMSLGIFRAFEKMFDHLVASERVNPAMETLDLIEMVPIWLPFELVKSEMDSKKHAPCLQIPVLDRDSPPYRWIKSYIMAKQYLLGLYGFRKRVGHVPFDVEEIIASLMSREFGREITGTTSSLIAKVTGVKRSREEETSEEGGRPRQQSKITPN